MERGLNYPITCETCHRVFKVKKYRQFTAKFCSSQCCGVPKKGKTAWNKGGRNWWMVGKNNPNWITDRESLRARRVDRRNPLYTKWRRDVLARDKYTCVLCKFTGWPLHADHIKRYALYPELRYDVDNGRTLCVPCHKKQPGWGKRLMTSTVA